MNKGYIGDTNTTRLHDAEAAGVRGEADDRGDEWVYRALQEHLDRQPVGLPATRSKAELRVLRHHFNPAEARVALGMTYRMETCAVIARRAGYSGTDVTMVRALLEGMVSRCSIMRFETDGEMRYALYPLLVGMYEGKVFTLGEEYIRDFDEYTKTMAFGLSFLSTDIPQMRTIPLEASIEPEHRIMSFDDVARIIDHAGGRIAVVPCICRKKHRISGDECRQTQRDETCMLFHDMAAMVLENKLGREIGKGEALEIIRKNQEEGLVLQTYNSRKPEFVCACCGCCCGMLNIQKMLHHPLRFWATNFRARMDSQACTGCFRCVKKCQVGALRLDKKKNKPVFIEERCIGCGQCVTACTDGAIRLKENEDIIVPPKDSQEMLETLMRNSPKWKLGRVLRRAFLGRPRHGSFRLKNPATVPGKDSSE